MRAVRTRLLHMKLSYLLICGFGFAGVIWAAPAATAQTAEQSAAFIQGDYDTALEGQAVSADDHAFRARSLLAKAMTANGRLPNSALLNEAREAAEAALAIDPGHIEGRLQWSLAMSLSTRAMSTRQVRRSGVGERSKAVIEGVLADDPDNINAHGFMMVWHLEVMQRGGRMGAMVMGASLREARAHYREAIQLDASDASIRWQYARALTLLDAKKHRSSIIEALEAAIDAPRETALEEVMHERALGLLAALKADGPKAAKRQAEQML